MLVSLKVLKMIAYSLRSKRADAVSPCLNTERFQLVVPAQSSSVRDAAAQRKRGERNN
jgi:hypothetical protein